MIDFITWLERELKQVKSKNAKELLNDLQKRCRIGHGRTPRNFGNWFCVHQQRIVYVKPATVAAFNQ